MNAIPNDACWRRIGVRGDGSCPELRRYIHCSACPVTMRAARSLLDRTDPGATLEPAPADAPPLVAGEGDLSFLVFRLGSEYFAIESSHAVEVVRPRHVQPIPHRRGLRGLCNLNGQLWPCASLHGVLGITEAADADPERRRLVVIGEPGRGFTFEADAVEGTHRIASEKLSDAPATVSRDASSCTRARFPLQDHWVALLDADRLLRRLEERLA